MPDHEGQLRLAQVAVHHMEIGPADPAGVHPHQNLAGPRLRGGQLGDLQGLALLLEDHRPHSPIIAP
jgi:hypothetical protein